MFDIFEIYRTLKAKLNTRDFVICVSLFCLYCFTRLLYIMRLPIFIDEGFYVGWAKLAALGPQYSFISLTDGRQPLQIWLITFVLKFLPQQPLYAGRLVSAITGMIALVGTMLLCYYLFGKRAAFIAGLLYIGTPFFLFYDRIALADSAVNAAFIWIIFLSIVMVRSQRLDIAILLGLVMGGSLLLKSTTQLFLLVSPLALTLVAKVQRARQIKQAISTVVLFILAIAISVALYSVLLLSPLFTQIATINTLYVVSFSELVQHPFRLFFQNLPDFLVTIIWESGIVLALYAVFGTVSLVKRRPILAMVLLTWFCFLLGTMAMIAKSWFPRYLIFFCSLLLIFATYFLSQLKPKVGAYGLGFFCMISIIFSYGIVVDYPHLLFSANERTQYIEGPTSGFGTSQILDYAVSQSHNRPVVIITEGDNGTLGYLFAAQVAEEAPILIKGSWPLTEKFLRDHQRFSKEADMYVVVEYKRQIPKKWPLKFVKDYKSGYEGSSLKLYRLIH